MKGPFERLKYDLRRVWECPECHHRERSSGAVTTLWCHCQQAKSAGPQLPMRLAEDGVRRVVPPPAPPPESEDASRRSESLA